MKKLTLNQTWRMCLKKWAWVDKIIAAMDACGRKREFLSVEELKEVWCLDHGYPDLFNNCFFCEYAQSIDSEGLDDCDNCPGRLVDKEFHCMNLMYDYFDKPHKFYAQLVKLDKKRRAKATQARRK